MAALTRGEVCAGYDGLGMAIDAVFGSRPVWFSEFDAAPGRILAYHFPGVPNYGDMTKIDWAGIEPADIISGGTPCQDLSMAGRRRGMTEGTRSNLWVQMREAVAIQRPEWVCWENVRGAYSAEAYSDLEQCPGCLGDPREAGTVLRALGRVLGDLSDLGYDCQWRGLRAADVGAPHGRFRVFVLAHDSHRLRGREVVVPVHGGKARADRLDEPDSGRGGLEPAADAFDVGHGRGLAAGVAPAAGDSGAAADAQVCGGDEERAAAACDEHEQTGGRCGCEPVAAAADAEGSHGRDAEQQHLRPSGRVESGKQGDLNWGPYESAIRRWEEILGRPAPRPTERSGSARGERLSARFTEWMMGLPEGWVTSPAIGLSRNEQLKACGNGVVPQQAEAAVRDMLPWFEAES